MEVGIFMVIHEKEEAANEGSQEGREGRREGGRRIVLSLRAEEIRMELMMREAEQGDGMEGAP
eukprot:evm.model.NODE_4206_length_1133_cov_17.533981.2